MKVVDGAGVERELWEPYAVPMFLWAVFGAIGWYGFGGVDAGWAAKLWTWNLWIGGAVVAVSIPALHRKEDAWSVRLRRTLTFVGSWVGVVYVEVAAFVPLTRLVPSAQRREVVGLVFVCLACALVARLLIGLGWLLRGATSVD